MKQLNLKTLFTADTTGIKKGASDAKNAIKDFDNAASSAMNDVLEGFGAGFGKIGSYLSAFQGGLLKVTQGFGSATSAAGGLTKAMGVLKTALVASGIGVLIAALGSVYSYFTRTQEGSDQLAVSMSRLKQVWRSLGDSASAVGQHIVESILGTKHQTASLLEMWLKIKDAFSSERFDNSEEYEKKRIEYEQLQIQYTKELSNLQIQLAEKRREAEDKTKYSAKERLDILEEVLKLEDSIIDRRKKLAKEELELKRMENDMSNSTRKDLLAEAELEAKVNQIEAERAMFQKEQVAKRNEIINAARKEQQEYANMITALSDIQQLTAKIKETEDQKLEAAKLTYSQDAVNKSLQEEINELTSQRETALDKLIGKMGSMTNEQLKQLLSLKEFKAIMDELAGRIDTQIINTTAARVDMDLEPLQDLSNSPELQDIKKRVEDSITIEPKVKIGIDDKALESSNEKLKEVEVSWTSTLSSVVSSFADSIGTLLGDLLSGEADAMDNFMDNILNILAKGISQVGQMLIQLGIAAIAFKSVLSNPYAAIAVGAALVALAAMVSAAFSNVTSGGAVTGVAGGGTLDVPKGYTNTWTAEQPVVQVSGELRGEGTQLVAVIKNVNQKKLRTT